MATNTAAPGPQPTTLGRILDYLPKNAFFSLQDDSLFRRSVAFCVSILYAIGQTAMFNRIVRIPDNFNFFQSILQSNPIALTIYHLCQGAVLAISFVMSLIFPYDIIAPAKEDGTDGGNAFVKGLIILNTTLVYSLTIAYGGVLAIDLIAGSAVSLTGQFAAFALFYLSGTIITYQLNTKWIPQAWAKLQEEWPKEGFFKKTGVYLFLSFITAIAFAVLSFQSSLFITQMFLVLFNNYSSINSFSDMAKLVAAGTNSHLAYGMGLLGALVTVVVGIPLLIYPSLNDTGSSKTPNDKATWFTICVYVSTVLQSLNAGYLTFNNALLVAHISHTARVLISGLISLCSFPLQFNFNKSLEFTIFANSSQFIRGVIEKFTRTNSGSTHVTPPSRPVDSDSEPEELPQNNRRGGSLTTLVETARTFVEDCRRLREAQEAQSTCTVF